MLKCPIRFIALLAVAGTRFTDAPGHLVLWSKQPRLVQGGAKDNVAAVYPWRLGAGLGGVFAALGAV